MQIGGKLRSGEIHDGRAPDYDDWSLNGDIVVYYPLLDMAYELSSMGIRVNAESLAAQLEERGCPDRAKLPFQRDLVAGDSGCVQSAGYLPAVKNIRPSAALVKQLKKIKKAKQHFFLLGFCCLLYIRIPCNKYASDSLGKVG